MASARNHAKRSHRSDKLHRQCLHSMKQFSPVGSWGVLMAGQARREIPAKKMGPRQLIGGNLVSKHIGGWLRSARKRNRKRANGSLEAAGV